MPSDIFPLLFAQYENFVTNRKKQNNCLLSIWFSRNSSEAGTSLGELLWEYLEFHFDTSSYEFFFLSFFVIMVNGHKTHSCVEKEKKRR